MLDVMNLIGARNFSSSQERMIIHMKRMTLNLKLFVGGLSLVLIPLVVVGFFSIIKASNALDEGSKREMLILSQDTSNTAQMTLSGEMKMVTELAFGNTVIDVATLVAKSSGNDLTNEIDSLTRKLSNAMKQIGKDYETIFVADVNGNIFVDGSDGSYKGINVADREYFKAAKGGKTNVGHLIKSRKTDKPIVPICSPVTSPTGEFVGAMTILLKVDYLIEHVADKKVGKTGYSFMVDKDGLIIAHPKRELILSTNVKNIKGMEQVTSRLIAGQAGVESYQFEGVNKIAGFAPVPLAGWMVVTTQDADEFLAPVHTIRNGILLIGFVMLAVMLVLVVLFARSLSRPISRVVNGLSDGADQVASASSQVSSASQQLAEGASEQAAAIEETSSSLEEMSSMVKQNADNANEANRLMAEANRVVEKASKSMNHLTSSMEEISVASEDTQKIIKTIDEIAFQTNLLALNAAVEAARAGEAGAGFAVVADEVRNLAMRAAEAAKNTASLIEATVKKVKDGSQSVVTTNQEFSEIAVSVNRSGELVAEIAAASTEQAQGIQQISHAVSEMEKVVQQNSATAEESAAASEEMNAQAEQMKEFVGSLAAIVGGNDKSGNTAKKKFSLKRSPTAQSHTAGALALRNPPAPQERPSKGKGNGNGAAMGKAKPPKREVSPEEVIPFDEDFKDF
jgi:methyl-accepting chemotaxis protein